MPTFTIDLAKLRCPDCGTTFLDFRRNGRLGCPYDYVVFRSGLLPLMDRIQRSQHHTGKKPKRLRGVIEEHRELRALRFQLRAAVDAEEFDRAAALRDLIREKERADGSQ